MPSFLDSIREFVGLARRVRDLEKQQSKIMATQAELAADLAQVEAKQKKTLAEIRSVKAEVGTLKDKIAALEAIIATGGATDELTAAVAAVKAQAQIVDDEIPDLPLEPAPTE